MSEEGGLWKRQGNTVTLYFPDEQADLFLTPLQYTTQYSNITGLKLVNNSSAFEGLSTLF